SVSSATHDIVKVLVTLGDEPFSFSAGQYVKLTALRTQDQPGSRSRGLGGVAVHAVPPARERGLPGRRLGSLAARGVRHVFGLHSGDDGGRLGRAAGGDRTCVWSDEHYVPGGIGGGACRHGGRGGRPIS